MNSSNYLKVNPFPCCIPRAADPISQKVQKRKSGKGRHWYIATTKPRAISYAFKQSKPEGLPSSFLPSQHPFFFHLFSANSITMSKSRLEGKVAIITGAASGIGEAAARLFVENGASVVIADIQDDLGHQVVASIGPDKCSYIHCDVTDEKQIEAAVSFTLENYGCLDILYSNAGMGGPSSGIMDLDLGELDRTMAVNFRGAAASIKHAARAMLAKGTRGSIICTTSIVSSRAGLAPHAYTVSKHALVGLVKSTTAELAKHGIRVNGISPYGVATPLACEMSGIPNVDPKLIETNTAAYSNLKGVVLKARHIAEAALFLASNDAEYISGHDLVVDGGFSIVQLNIQAKS